MAGDVLSSLKDFFAAFIPRSWDSEVRNYIPFILFAVIFLLFVLYTVKLLRTVAVSFAKTLRRMKESYEETAKARAERKSVMRKVKLLLKNKSRVSKYPAERIISQ